MILRLLCIWLGFYSLLSSLMHGTMNLKLKECYRLAGNIVICTLHRYSLCGDMKNVLTPQYWQKH
jgi:hypothetical protein